MIIGGCKAPFFVQQPVVKVLLRWICKSVVADLQFGTIE